MQREQAGNFLRESGETHDIEQRLRGSDDHPDALLHISSDGAVNRRGRDGPFGPPPRTDPSERNYRTGLLPRVVTRRRCSG
jgi:hypothetical protein